MEKKRYIFFSDPEFHAAYLTPETKEQIDLAFSKMQIIYAMGWDNLDMALKAGCDAIGFSIKTLSSNLKYTFIEMLMMIRTRMSVLGVETPIVVGFYKDTPLSYIKSLKKEGIQYFLPSPITYSTEEMQKAIDAIQNRQPYYPKHLIDQLPGAVKKKTIQGQIELSERQLQILSLIKQRGAPNKVIAKALNLSESTVKLHVGAILRKYGLKNRTQLALFTNDQTV